MVEDMSHYSIWRAISAARAASMLDGDVSLLGWLSEFDGSSDGRVIRMEQAGGRTYFWELVGTVDAMYMEAYGEPVATLFDSTAVCDEYHYFQVVAHTTDPRVFWKSEPDIGYSVDNLSPCVPQGLGGVQSYVPEGLNLVWRRNVEADLGGYRVYRGITEDFVPGVGNLVESLCDTVFFDGEWRWDAGYFYKVFAVDVHGNESGYALLRQEDVTGDDTPGDPRVSYLA